MPRCAARFGVIRVMSTPSNRIRPSSGCNTPVIRLNGVVFPAPFGPTMNVMVFSSMENATSLTARNPPNRLLT
jgi:hypothetical protein